MLVATLGLVALLKPDHAKRVVGHHPSKKQILIIFGPLTVLALVGVVFGFWLQNRSQTAKKGLTNSASNTSVLQKADATELLPSYEVLSETTKGNDTRVTVFVGGKDAAKLGRLNDKLLGQYKAKITKTSLYIDYFDDRQSAIDYFSKITNKKTTQTEKTKLTSHYVAITTYSSQLGAHFTVLPDVQKLLK